MTNVILEILDGLSLVWVLMYQRSKSAFLQVTLNFELEWILVVDILTQILLTRGDSLTFIALPILRKI